MGHFPLNFRSPLAPKLLDRLKKIKKVQYGTHILYLHAKFGRDPPLHGVMRKKSWQFFLFFSESEPMFTFAICCILSVCLSVCHL